MAEHLVVGRNDDLDVFELGVGDLDRLGAERDVVVGRRAALFRAVFRRRLRVHARARRRECRSTACPRRWCRSRPPSGSGRGTPTSGSSLGIGLGFQRHQFGFRIGRLQARLQRGQRAAKDSWRRTASRDRRTARPCRLHVLEGGDQVARLQVVARPGRRSRW